jgi:hypothetical protein
MSNTKSNEFIDLLKTVGVYLLGILSFLVTVSTTVINIIGIYRENASIILPLWFGIGLVVLSIVCLYVALGRKKVEPLDERLQPYFVPRFRRSVRLLSFLVLTATLVVSTYSITGLLYKKEPASSKFLILVAEFDGPKAEEHDINWSISREIKRAAEECNSIDVKEHPSTISNSQEAFDLGVQNNASIVIWGSYRKTEDTEDIPISVNFQPVGIHLPSPFEVEPEANGATVKIPKERFYNFEFELLANNLTFLSLFSIGTSCQMANQPDAALYYYNAAKQAVENSEFLSSDIEAYF